MKINWWLLALVALHSSSGKEKNKKEKFYTGISLSALVYFALALMLGVIIFHIFA